MILPVLLSAAKRVGLIASVAPAPRVSVSHSRRLIMEGNDTAIYVGSGLGQPDVTGLWPGLRRPLHLGMTILCTQHAAPSTQHQQSTNLPAHPDTPQEQPDGDQIQADRDALDHTLIKVRHDAPR